MDMAVGPGLEGLHSTEPSFDDSYDSVKLTAADLVYPRMT